MIDPAIQADILRLFFRENLTLRAIAEKMRVHRTTVAAVVRRRSVRLNADEKKPRRSILEPHHPYIEELLRKDASREGAWIPPLSGRTSRYVYDHGAPRYASHRVRFNGPA
jgi:hypothetical protein